jgi:hypothetical protein
LKVILIAFFREKASSIVNLCWKDNLYTTYYVEAGVTFMGHSEKKAMLKNGVIDGSCTMTTPHNTQVRQCSNSWWKNKSH